MAQQALTAQVACGGRFVLGIGLSHRFVIENLLGLSFERRAAHLDEYLSVLDPLLRGEQADFHGEEYRVSLGLQTPDARPIPVMVAALGPALLRIAGRRTAGTITWMTGLKTLETHTVPTIVAAAKQAGRPAPPVVAGFPIALSHDAEAAREIASKRYQVYGQLPSYRAMLDREGAEKPGDVALVGDERALRAEIRRLEEIGITDFDAEPFVTDEGSVERTIDFLESLN
jgi:F420-dependent oxidoreductase-like protein